MRREAKYVGWFLLILGIASIAINCLTLAGGDYQASGTSCKAICGISLLISEVFNPVVGNFIKASLGILIGSGFAFFGYLLLKDTRKRDS